MTQETSTATKPARPAQMMPLIWSRAASTLAFSMLWIILPIYVLENTGSALAAGLAATGNVLPYIVLGIFVGAALEGRNLKKFMVSSEALNAFIVGGLALSALAGVLSPWTAAVLGACSSIVFVVFDVANSAVVPLLLAGQDVFRWNGRSWMVTSVCGAVGAPLAAALYDALGPAAALSAAAGLYAVSAVFLTGAPAVPGDSRTPSGFSGADVRAGFSFIRRTRVVAMMTAVGLGSGLSGGAVYGMTVVFAAQALATPSGVGLQVIVLCSGAGAVVGALLAPRLSRALGTLPMVRILLVLDAFLMLGFALSPSWPSAAAAIGAWNAVHTAVIVLSVSLRQTLTPQSLQARVNSAAKVLAWGAVPVGTLVCGWLTEVVGIRLSLLIMLAPVTISALIFIICRGLVRAPIDVKG